MTTPAVADKARPLRVVVADDWYLVREGARSALSTIPGIDVVGTAADGDELLEVRLGAPAQLAEALREVAAGGSILDPKVVDGLLEAQRRRSRSRLHGLTEREHEVLAMMAGGRTNAAIARVLCLTERAVEKHINAIFRKLGISEELDMNHRVAAVLFFLQRQTA